MLSRREFGQTLGAGLLVAVIAPAAIAQTAPVGNRKGGGFRGNAKPVAISARLHIGQDGIITVMTGKVECGQGARAELTQAAAEELRVSAAMVRIIMADTGLVPDDGMTAGSATTPRTVPAIRQGAAAGREALLAIAAKQWGVEATKLEARDGIIHDPTSLKESTYGELASLDEATQLFANAVDAQIALTPVKEWKVLGTPLPRPNQHELVTGRHQYPSDIVRPGMLYGKILRAPAYGAKLKSIDLAPARAVAGVIAVQEGTFTALAAPTRFLAEQALAAAAKTAAWEDPPAQPSSDTLFEYLSLHAKGGVPKNPFADLVSKAAKARRQTYHVSYAQHAPMEPRAAVAEWQGDKLTVWTGTQNPFGVRNELAKALNVEAANIRVIVPDFGGGFGGKHSGEAAVEAARLAKLTGKPISLRWTRQEEFTWAYFRPAGVIIAEASLDADHRVTSWHFLNINSGGSAVETPYDSGKADCRFLGSDGPLRSGSYRGLASTANTFARECFMDELAADGGADPLAFRRAHLTNDRLRAVLDAAAGKFNWDNRRKSKRPENVGIGLACGTEKGSFAAACAEVLIDPAKGTIRVVRVAQAYECGAIINPANLMMQVQGSIVMGIGPALREEMRFKDGRIESDSFTEYRVPRFADVPEMDIVLVDRPDIPSIGAGETPIIAIAPAIANAVFDATGQRLRSMPLRLAKA